MLFYSAANISENIKNINGCETSSSFESVCLKKLIDLNRSKKRQEDGKQTKEEVQLHKMWGKMENILWISTHKKSVAQAACCLLSRV